MTDDEFTSFYIEVLSEIERLENLYKDLPIVEEYDDETISKRIEESYEDIKKDKNFYPFLDDVLEKYQTLNAEKRRSLRSLFAEHSAFSWIAHINEENRTKEDYFLKTFLLISLKGDHFDTRDLILNIQSLRQEAIKEDVNIQYILEKVAKLSSDSNRFGMGSIKDLLS